MEPTANLEKLARTISTLDRGQVESRIRNFKGRFRLDFSDEYLRSLTVDRLRHILFAAMVTKCKRAN